MKSIFILNKYGLSMTILKKLFDLNITYIDLEFFGEKVLVEKNVRNPKPSEIMEIFYKSLEYKQNNIADELQFYELNRNYLNAIKEKNISLEDIDTLNIDEFCIKYNVKKKMYNEVQEAYNKFNSNNKNIKIKDNYSKYLLSTIKEKASLKYIKYDELRYLLSQTTYPINNLNEELNFLYNNNQIIVENDNISFKLPSIIEVINDLDEKKKTIITERLSGKTLQEVANMYDLTRERIRQIIENIYSKIDFVYEDIYKNIYEKYELSEQQFTTIFREPISTYYYLFDKYKKGNLEFTELEKKYSDDKEMLKRIKSLKNEICLNGIFINGDRSGVTKYYLKYIYQDEIVISSLYKELNNFIENDLREYNIERYESEHNLEAFLSRKTWCVFGRNKKIRYYEMDLLSKNDISKLEELLDVEYGLYSSLHFYENNLDLMEELNINNEQELHNILKNLVTLENIKYLRMPNILIGFNDKEEFFKEKFMELSPIKLNEFLIIMRNDYGHREDTLLSYLTMEFKEYLTGDTINSKTVDIPFESLRLIISKLNKYVYSINEFKEILKESNIENYSQVMNNINLKKINYKIMGSYVMKDSFNNMEDAIYTAITKGDLTHSFVTLNSTSYAIISKLEKNYKIIEINKKYYPFENIYNLGISKNDIDKFLDSVRSDFSVPEYYFTTKNVREKIDSVLFDHSGINDSLLNSLIKLLDGFKRITWHDNTIFCYSPLDFVSRKSFLYSLIKRNNGISINELNTQLKKEYGLQLNNEQIKYVVYDIDVELINDFVYLKNDSI